MAKLDDAILFRVSKEQKNKLKEISKQTRISVAQLIKSAININYGVDI